MTQINGKKMNPLARGLLFPAKIEIFTKTDFGILSSAVPTVIVVTSAFGY